MPITDEKKNTMQDLLKEKYGNNWEEVMRIIEKKYESESSDTLEKAVTDAVSEAGIKSLDGKPLPLIIVTIFT